MIDPERFEALKEKTHKLFLQNPLVRCPFFGSEVTLNSDGFHHLQFSARRERAKEEQVLKFSLVPLALQVIRKSGTHQEYRKTLEIVGEKKRDGFSPSKKVQYWAFVAIIGEKPIKIRVILRQIGDGKIVFWSVMPAMKLSRDESENIRQLAKHGIEDE